VALARETARGAILTIGSGIGARAVGLVSTLVLARFLAPSAYGEVTVAAVLVMTASQLSTLGFGQFLIANPKSPRSTAFHVTVFHVASGLITLGVLLGLGSALGTAFDAPGMTRFLPGLALAAALDRIGYVPERVLVRELRFGVLSVSRTVADLGYSAASITLAALGGGAAAIVVGNLVRSAVRAAFFVGNVDRRDWLEPSPLTRTETRALFAFGIPMAIGASASFAARRWDNLLVSHYFGPGPTGAYNLAYNLADVPAIQVGEQIGDVLLPSFARLEPSRRPPALLRSMALLGLVVFPLAVGLGAVAPTLVSVLFDERWRSIGPMLVLLSALSVTRPVGWTVASYLQASGRPVHILWLEVLKLVCLLGGIATLGRASPLFACGAVGLAFALHALASLWVIQRVEGVPLGRSIACLLPALGACIPLVAAVLGARLAWEHAGAIPRVVALLLEIAAGTAGYLLGAWFMARRASEDLLARLVEALRARREAT
jgi:lipopolysaccharide exporter